jgi:hypothetical protein
MQSDPFPGMPQSRGEIEKGLEASSWLSPSWDDAYHEEAQLAVNYATQIWTVKNVSTCRAPILGDLRLRACLAGYEVLLDWALKLVAAAST